MFLLLRYVHTFAAMVWPKCGLSVHSRGRQMGSPQVAGSGVGDVNGWHCSTWCGHSLAGDPRLPPPVCVSPLSAIPLCYLLISVPSALHLPPLLLAGTPPVTAADWCWFAAGNCLMHRLQ